MGLLDGKVAIVTGAGHGIGRGHALELAKEGAKVVVNDLGTSLRGEGEGKDADLTVDLIKERGGDAIPNYGNVTDFDAMAELVDQAVDVFGRLDILVNNAGIARDATIWNMTEADWDAVINVHLKGTFVPTHHAIKHWRARNKDGDDVSYGRVINTTSGAGLVGNFGQANYTAAKAGIAAFTMTVSLEVFKLGRHGQLHRSGRRHPHGGVDPRRRHRGQGARRVRGVEPHGSLARFPARGLAGQRQGRPRDRAGHPLGRRRDRAHAAVEQRPLDPEAGQAVGSRRAVGADERRPVPLPGARPALLSRRAGRLGHTCRRD